MNEKEMNIDETESKKERIGELLEKREEYANNGEIEKEIEVLRELRILFKSVFGVESEENIKILTELGNSLKYIGKFKEAIRLLARAENIIIKKYGEDSMAFVMCNANMAEVYRIMRNYDKVEEKYFKAIKTYKKNNFKNTYIFAGICNNLGLVYEENKCYQDSINWQKRALKELKDLRDRDSEIQSAIVLSNMVKPYVKLKEKELAEITMDETLGILKKEIGEYSTLYSNILNNWSNVYFEDKDYKKSLELLEKCEKICRIMLGTENKNYGDILKKIETVKKEVNKKKIEQYVWKNQIIKKVKN
ncbi:tetratricopeptide repeat protein [Leptotrichia alba]|uniref:Tetratricopeptide repeat protein n=1 Tax=Leptotrichia alba TaxID=3239304 RepID=A0AB39V4D1_9FUSO